MVIAGLAGSTALKAVTDATAVAEQHCLFILTVLYVFTGLDLMWFGKPLDVGKRLKHVLKNLCCGFNVLVKLFGLFGSFTMQFHFLYLGNRSLFRRCSA